MCTVDPWVRPVWVQIGIDGGDVVRIVLQFVVVMGLKARDVLLMLNVVAAAASRLDHVVHRFRLGREQTLTCLVLGRGQVGVLLSPWQQVVVVVDDVVDVVDVAVDKGKGSLRSFCKCKEKKMKLRKIS